MDDILIRMKCERKTHDLLMVEAKKNYRSFQEQVRMVLDKYAAELANKKQLNKK